MTRDAHAGRSPCRTGIADGRHGGLAPFIALLFIGALAATPAGAQTATTLHIFTGPDGAAPYAGLVTDAAGNLYGTTSAGGSAGFGTIFKLDPSGVLTTLHTFAGQPGDGSFPLGTLVMDAQGNLYGTTTRGGNAICLREGWQGCGTIFKLDASGTFAVLHNFTGAFGDGDSPQAGLIQDGAGNLYGTTVYGGSHDAGTVFVLAPSGALAVLHSFASESADGFWPRSRLARDSAGNLYGTTSQGGSPGGAGSGIVFKISPAGTETVLHTFTGSDGAGPNGGLVMDASGNLFGATGGGGSAGSGTIFKLDPDDALTVLYTFTGSGGDGRYPNSDLILDATGTLYGTTWGGGNPPLSGANGCVSGCGTVFRLDPSGSETVLHRFTRTVDGAQPNAGLLMDAAGALYGTTSPDFYSSPVYPADRGTVFKLTLEFNAPSVTVSFPAPPDGQQNFFNAFQTPVVGDVNASDPSNVTAISCTDSLGGLAAGPLVGGGTGEASRTLTVTGDGIHAISCMATDGVGNTGAGAGSTNAAVILIDTTAPAVTYSGNLGTYTVDQNVNITCAATDALSGLASSTCADIQGLASTFGLGDSEFGASALDHAGNRGIGSTRFTVIPRPTFLLNVTIVGTGGGTVTSVPPRISCPVNCAAVIEDGTSIVLAAASNIGWRFDGWSGACVGTGSCTVTVHAATTVTATFVRQTYPLIVHINGTGGGSVRSVPPGINCPTGCTASFTYGTSVALTATANTGWRFAGWTGGCTGSGACAVSITAPTAITATFIALAADLATTSVSSPPAVLSPGGFLPVTDTVGNLGTSAAGTSATRYYLSADRAKGPGDVLLLGLRFVWPLNPSATSTGTTIVVVPPGTSLGTYYLLACANDTGSVPETNRANNCEAAATAIRIALPDLVVTSVNSVQPWGFVEFSRVVRLNLNATISNVGAVAAGRSLTSVYLSRDPVRGPEDVRLLSWNLEVPTLAPGASRTGTLGGAVFFAPRGTVVTGGLYYVLACADEPANAVRESNESNNCIASTSRVRLDVF